MIGAAVLALDEHPAGARDGRRAVDEGGRRGETSERSGGRRPSGPADRLPHPDREPGGHHAPGPGGAARGRPGWPARTPAGPGCLLERYGVSAKLVSYHEHNEAERSDRAVRRMHRGETVALVSDAGMPPRLRSRASCCRAVWPPGWPWRCSRARRRAGRPGGQRASRRHWRFAGFLPRKRSVARGGILCSRDAGGLRVSRRLAASLGVLAGFDLERPVAVGRELTKLHEEVVRGSAAELAERFCRHGRPEARSCWWSVGRRYPGRGT